MTPEFKIENDHWYVRFGEGEWQDLGVAKGEQGDSLFSKVEVGADAVVFTMADGTQFTVPFIANAKFSDIQSLKFVPEYEDNMGSVLFSSKEDATIEMNFEVLPKKYAAVVAAKDFLQTAAMLHVNKEAYNLSDGEIFLKATGLAAAEFAMGVLLRSVSDESAIEGWSKMFKQHDKVFSSTDFLTTKTPNFWQQVFRAKYGKHIKNYRKICSKK